MLCGKGVQHSGWPGTELGLSNVIPSPGILQIVLTTITQTTSAAVTRRGKLSFLQLIPPKPRSKPVQNPVP